MNYKIDTNNTGNNQGQIAKSKIRQNGYRLNHIAKCLQISRNTLNSWLKKEKLTPKFLFRLGKIINHNFGKTFPELERDEKYIEELQKDETPEIRESRELLAIQEKYYQTLESYNKLLKFLVRIVNDNGLYELKKKIDSLTGTTNNEDI